jgi:single-strand DNA-binding protein
MNKAILIGNVGRDPNVKYFEGGRAVAQVTLATTERGYTLQNGTVVPDRTEWHNLVFRNGLAQTVEKYVHKGDKLYVEGKILTRSYDDQSGIKRYVTEIYVDEMEMLTPKANQSAPAPQPAASPSAQPAAPVQQAAESADDLPF